MLSNIQFNKKEDSSNHYQENITIQTSQIWQYADDFWFVAGIKTDRIW